MTVIINEFEVVAQPPPDRGGEAAPAESSGPPPGVDRVIRALRERAARVWAH